MKERVLERDGPFDGNGRAIAFFQDLERDGRLDIVVVGERDEGMEIQRFDLRRFEPPGLMRT